MSELPHRTGTTWLTDAQLVLLDEMFSVHVPFRLLREETFRPQFNVPYSHGFNDAELEAQLRALCNRGVLGSKTRDDSMTTYTLSQAGGALWSEERAPIWSRYVSTRHGRTHSGLDQFRVVGEVREVVEQFVDYAVRTPLKIREIRLHDCGLLPWRSFPSVFALFVTYAEKRKWGPTELEEYSEEHERRRGCLSDRTWWQKVGQLQKFIDV